MSDPAGTSSKTVAATPVVARGLPWGAGLVALVLQLLTALNPRVVEVDHEEMFNAGQAWAVLQGHAGDLFRLQYREFCGGCTADALLAVPLFATLGPRFLVWKLVPIAYTVLLVVVGSSVLMRRAGTVTAAAFSALVLLPPRAWLHLSLIAWGNHYEAGVVGTVGLLLLGDALSDKRPSALRVALAGWVVGLAVWIGFSGGFAAVGAVGALLWSRRLRSMPWLLVGVWAGLLPWALQLWTTGQHPFVTIYEAGESVPRLARIPMKVRTLVWPRQQAALFGFPDGTVGVLAGMAWGTVLSVSAAVALRRGNRLVRTVGTGLLAWVVIYLLVRFQVAEPPPPSVAVPGSCRYAAPLFPLAFVVVASAVGVLWQRGRKALAVGLVAVPLSVGLGARVEALQAPFPETSSWTMHAVDWPFFRNQFSYVLPAEAHFDPVSTDPFSRRAHAYGAARETAAGLLRDPAHEALSTMPVRPEHLPVRGWWQGVGDALGSHHQDRLPDTLAILKQSASLLDTVPDVDADTHALALRGVAVWQMHAADDWIRSIDHHDARTFAAVHQALDPQDRRVSQAAWWAVGFTWAHHVAGFQQPVPMRVPVDEDGLPHAFVEGFAFALAEEWGPQDTLSWVEGLPRSPAAVAAFETGWRSGLVDRWLCAPQVPRLVE